MEKSIVRPRELGRLSGRGSWIIFEDGGGGEDGEDRKGGEDRGGGEGDR